MSEQIAAEIVTEEPPIETEPTAPVEQPEPTQIEDEPAEAEEPAPEPAAPDPTPEVTASVTQGANGVWTVNIFTQHPDAIDVAVNGKGVWRGIP